MKIRIRIILFRTKIKLFRRSLTQTLMDSISVKDQDEPIEIDKDDSNDENNMTSNDGSPKMIWLDHIEQGLILLISRNSENSKSCWQARILLMI